MPLAGRTAMKTRRLAVAFALLVPLVSAPACGSASNDEDDGATGGDGGGGGGVGSCAQGEPCFGEGDSCTDNGCCPCAYECHDGKWEMEACAGCAAPECPVVLPEQGQACDGCSAPTGDCLYEDCSAGGTLTARCVADATSSARTWQLEAVECPASPPCGADPGAPTCATGQVCVQATITVGPMSSVSFTCADNPCTPSPTSCACAQSLCVAANAPMCIEASPVLVQCDNGAQ